MRRHHALVLFGGFGHGGLDSVQHAPTRVWGCDIWCRPLRFQSVDFLLRAAEQSIVDDCRVIGGGVHVAHDDEVVVQDFAGGGAPQWLRQ